jgi:4-hydroxybenzoate polyprenyltransferase
MSNSRTTDAPVGMQSPLLAVARLVRLEYCALGAVGVFFGAYLTSGAVLATPVLLSAASVFFVAAGCYAFDDLSDLACDRVNQRTDRPLVNEELTPDTARAIGVASFSLAVIAAVLAGTAAGLLIVLGALVAMVYNRWLRGIIPLKNVLFAGVFPVPLLVGWLSGGGEAGPLFLYTLGLVFVVGLGFETMIDLADAEGDRRSGITTFATRYGSMLSSRLAAALHIAGAVLVVLLFFLPVDARLRWNIVFLALAAAAALSNGLIGINLVKNHSAVRVLVLKRQAFITLNAGLLAIVLGVLVATPLP